jgi:NhaP-type Na+/H+ or K+/H+ antiporter
VATLSLALIAFLVASGAGGNPFVAAFIGGLVFGASATADAARSTELAEQVGALLSLVLWFVFGAAFVLPALEQLDARVVVYAVLSVTVVRMVPVTISFLGSGEDRVTTAFVGWFGPRGLASVLFALLAIEELGGFDPRVLTAVDVIAVTIVLSVVVHGVTARPLATRYLTALRTNPRRSADPSGTSPGG